LSYISVYSDDVPLILERICEVPEMKRLLDVGMHCGCEYSSVPLYMGSDPYSRFEHSLGVARIVWNFTRDIKQAVAGLLHDIATPVFAHTIDFMNEDHVSQESTEDMTSFFISGSEEIAVLLEENGIHIDDVSDYHKYPIADNDTPMLSADRLEYTIGNAFTVYHTDLEQLRGVYNDLVVAENELGIDELCFRNVDIARLFVRITLRNSRFYVSNEDRYLMQCLADVVSLAIDRGVLSHDDLLTTEGEVIGKLLGDTELSAAWGRYTQVSAVGVSPVRLSDVYCVRIPAKRRFIDPLVINDGGVCRVSALDAGIRAEIDEFLSLDFGDWLFAK